MQPVHRAKRPTSNDFNRTKTAQSFLLIVIPISINYHSEPFPASLAKRERERNLLLIVWRGHSCPPRLTFLAFDLPLLAAMLT